MKNVLKKKLMVLVLVLSMLTGVFGFTETANAKVYSWMENATTLSLGKIVSGEFTKTGEKVYCISVPETLYLDFYIAVPGTKTTGMQIYGSSGKLFKSFYSNSREWSYSKTDDVSIFEYGATFTRGKYYIGIKNYGKASLYDFVYYGKLDKEVSLKSIRRYSANSTKITWVKTSSVTGYEVYRSTTLNGTYKRIATVPASKNSCIDKPLKSGRSYYYIVRAYKVIKGKKIYSFNSDTGAITLSR